MDVNLKRLSDIMPRALSLFNFTFVINIGDSNTFKNTTWEKIISAMDL